MISGIGVDIVAVERLARLFERHGASTLEKILSPEEIESFRERFAGVAEGESPLAERRRHAQARFLAKRFAAKEALGKAFGIGISAPLVLPAVTLAHDARGKPGFSYAPELAAWIAERGVSVQLSLSDEHDYVVAFVILERQ
ncbi:MAG: holo-ACP synthase [Betaproteobacteria bacterium]|nr:holo-ACP synthase [Betaproteobacteria bacterium]